VIKVLRALLVTLPKVQRDLKEIRHKVIQVDLVTKDHREVLVTVLKEV
jgi:hypothetical protein